MNSGSERKLSMDELLEKNRPAQTAQITSALSVQSTPQPLTQEQTPTPEVHPTKEDWEDLQSDLYTLGYHAERQTGYLKKVSELLEQFPTWTQVDELLKVLKHLEQMTEQAGKPKENSFSLHRIRLPRLHLPHVSIPALISLLMAAAALLLLWWGLGTVWSSSGLRGTTPTERHCKKNGKRKSPSVTRLMTTRTR